MLQSPLSKLKNKSWKSENGKRKVENGNLKREVAWHLSAKVPLYTFLQSVGWLQFYQYLCQLYF